MNLDEDAVLINLTSFNISNFWPFFFFLILTQFVFEVTEHNSCDRL